MRSLGSSIVHEPSANTTVVIFTPSRAADCISMKLKPAAPSPVTQTTSRVGAPSFAPIAEGMPVPSMPSSRMPWYDEGRVDGNAMAAHSDDDAAGLSRVYPFALPAADHAQQRLRKGGVPRARRREVGAAAAGERPS